MATDAQGWSSLPADLVNRVADCVLADNDLDYYMAMRAVCQGWRSSTADPKAGHDDARFHPTRWIVLDELDFDSDTRLFVNATTGRFVRRRLPLLRDYHFVTSTTGGFLVLAEKEPPHAARVLNPFTGSLIRFRAPMPSELHMAADVVGTSSPTLVIYSSSNKFRFFHAAPDSEQFLEVRLPEPGSDEPVPPLQSDGNAASVGPVAISFLVLRCLAVKLASGEMLRVCGSSEQGVRLFRMSSVGGTMERVHSIGGLALFVGTRCMFVHADSFPSIKANCIYYVKAEEDGSSSTYMYDLAHDKEERIEESNIFIDPASILQLLFKYTMCSPCYKPASDELDQMRKFLYSIPIEDILMHIADDPFGIHDCLMQIPDDLEELEDNE
ncbi:unnamed protein product [Urochloa humidicola]